MSNVISLLPEGRIKWEFQVELQSFITRYGCGGGLFWKQVILQPGHMVPVYPIKRIDERIYKTAQRLAKEIE